MHEWNTTVTFSHTKLESQFHPSCCFSLCCIPPCSGVTSQWRGDLWHCCRRKKVRKIFFQDSPKQCLKLYHKTVLLARQRILERESLVCEGLLHFLHPFHSSPKGVQDYHVFLTYNHHLKFYSTETFSMIVKRYWRESVSREIGLVLLWWEILPQ